MSLVSLIYTSDAIGSVDVESILSVTRRQNETNSITGTLFFRADHFIQCLEGSREAVNQAYARIMKDERHENLLLLDYRDICERSFPGWSMGYLPESSISQPTLLKYSGSQRFDPRQLGGEGCLRMLVELNQKVNTA